MQKLLAHVQSKVSAIPSNRQTEKVDPVVLQTAQLRFFLADMGGCAPPDADVKSDSIKPSPRAAPLRAWVYNVDDLASLQLEVTEVHPPSCWERKQDIIFAPIKCTDDTRELTLVRLRHDAAFARFDLVLTLEFRPLQDKVFAYQSIRAFPRDIPLGDVVLCYPDDCRMVQKTAVCGGYGHNFELELEVVDKGLVFEIKVRKTDEDWPAWVPAA